MRCWLLVGWVRSKATISALTTRSQFLAHQLSTRFPTHQLSTRSQFQLSNSAHKFRASSQFYSWIFQFQHTNSNPAPSLNSQIQHPAQHSNPKHNFNTWYWFTKKKHINKMLTNSVHLHSNIQNCDILCKKDSKSWKLRKSWKVGSGSLRMVKPLSWSNAPMRHPHLSPGANIQQKLFTASKKYKYAEIQLYTEIQIYTDIQISKPNLVVFVTHFHKANFVEWNFRQSLQW